MSETRAWAGLAIIAILITSNAGCALVRPVQEISQETMRSMKPNPHGGYRDTTEEPDDEWSFTGTGSRNLRPMEHEEDPLKSHIMSPKARSIERSLGID